MKINKTELIEILSIKTGLEKEEVEDQLKELIKRIKDAASRGKALEIKGFGIFYFDDAKNLRFDPADSFRTEVNFKYAGMEPVEVKPPRDTSVDTTDPEEVPIVDEDVFGLEDETDEPADEPEIEIEAGFSSDEKLAEEIDISESPEEEEDMEEESKPSFMFDSGEEDEASFDYLFGAEEKEAPEPVPDEELKKAGTAPSPGTDIDLREPDAKSEKKKRDPVIMILAAVLAVVVLVAGFFIISDMMDAPPRQDPVAADMPVEQPPAEAEQDVTEAGEPEPADEVQATDEPAEPVADEAVVYGLTGDLVSGANDGYTIVLYSMRRSNNADAAAERLRNDGYRTIVAERTVGGDRMYRVSVGQFESVSSAQQQANNLPEPYRNQNFIQRIQ